jgi:TonB family protein
MRHATFGLLVCLALTASMMVNAQFKEVGPPPVSATVARERVRTLLEKVDPGNRQQTVAVISGLLIWYRDLVDEELIAAWQEDGRANLTDVMESLADSHLASAIVEFSWRRQRQTTFLPAYAPMLGHLMARYPDSAKPFLDDLLASAATGQQALDLSQGEAEAVCRILLDMPDVRTWKKSALQILPHYRRDAENLLGQDLQGADRGKSDRAQLWLTDLKAIDPAFNVKHAATPKPPDVSALSAPKLLPATRAGVILTPLNPAAVDDTFASVAGAPAVVDFVNRSNSPVDVYWINYQGDRVLYFAGLRVGATWSEPTSTNHPWLVVVSGTGGTTAQDTGMRLAAFQAVTPRNALDPSIRDTAIITNPDGTSAKGANPVAAPPGAGTAGTDGVYRTGGGVSPPVALTRVDPEYSEVARKLTIAGTVLLAIVIDQSGTAREFKVIKSLGYGLDEKAVEAVRKWRFRPGMKDGNAVATRATIEVNFRLLGERQADRYYAGPMTFGLEAGLTPPAMTDGTMPKPAGDKSNESVVLEFTVDFTGAVNNIHSMSGSQSASALLSRSLATWKFQPAMKGDQPVEAAGTVSFVKGQGTEVAKLPVSPPPLPRANPSEQAPAPNAPAVNGAQIRTMMNPTDGQRYVWIPPGAFTMGCSPGDSECDNNEKPPREVRIANGFWLGQTEVTQAAYVRVTGGNPSAHKGDQLPVESLTRDHAANYCTAIGGRLPKEAEWEYAARAGIAWARYASLDTIAWYSGNSDGTTHPVAQKQPNAFGLNDMLGNVWEWVEDSYAGTPSKILRGGSSQADVTNARASRRWVVEPAAGTYRGFRCAGEFTEPGPKAAAPLSEPARALNLLALYKLSGDGSDATGLSGPFSLANTFFRGGSLYLNGVYGQTKDKNGYRAIAPVPRLNYLHFTAALDFNAETFNPPMNAILHGGTSYRWWGLGSKDGVLELTLNNGSFRHAFEGGNLSQGAWHNVICSVDLPAGVIRTVLDGRALPDVQLPQGFRLEVIGTAYEASDKSFTFTNYSNAAVFQGYVNNLRIYGESLSAAELQILYRSIANQAPGNGGGSAGIVSSGDGEVSPPVGSGVAGGVFRAGGGVSAPVAIFRVDPEYSEEARKAKYSGTAVLSIVVDTEGRARDIRVVKSLGMGLDEKAIQAVEKWKFTPAMKDGRPVNVRTFIEVDFRLL